MLNIVDDSLFEILDPKTELIRHFDDDQYIKWLYSEDDSQDAKPGLPRQRENRLTDVIRDRIEREKQEKEGKKRLQKLNKGKEIVEAKPLSLSKVDSRESKVRRESKDSRGFQEESSSNRIQGFHHRKGLSGSVQEKELQKSFSKASKFMKI